MRKTRLFIQKEPALRNNTFSKNVVVNNSSPTRLLFDSWDDYSPALAGTPPAAKYFPNQLRPWDGTTTTALVQDIGAVSGIYTIAVEIEKYDRNDSVYDGNYCVGIGNKVVYLGPNGTVSTMNPSVLSDPGVYIFTLTVSESDLNDPVFGNKLNITASGNQYLASHPIRNLGIKSIYIKDFVGDYHEVDLYDDVDVSITYNVADVRDISKKDSNYSYTFNIPNTSENAQLFDLVSEIASHNSTFELERSYKAYMDVDGYRTFEGLFKLNKVVINDTKEISYQGNLYSNFIEFVKTLGTSTLRGNENTLNDLNFSSDTVLLTESEMYNRLTSMPNGMLLTLANKPFIVGGYDEWGGNWTGDDVKTNQPFITDANFPGNLIHPWFFDQLTPCLRIKDIWDKIFADARYNYVSEFLNNTADNRTDFDFTKLVYPYTGANTELGDGEGHCIISLKNATAPTGWLLYLQGDNKAYLTQLLPVYGATTQTPNISSSRYSLDDNLSGSSLASWIFTAPTDGYFRVKANMLLQLCTQMWYQPAATTIVPIGDTVNCTDTSNYDYSIYAKMYIQHAFNNITVFANGDKTENLKSNYYQHNPDGQNYFDQNIFGETEVKADETFYMHAGERIIFEVGFRVPAKRTDSTALYVYNGYNAFPYQFQLYLRNNIDVGENIIEIQQISNFGIGNKFDPTYILNPKTKKIDFINSIIKKFNLYFEDISGKYDVNTNTYYGERTFRIEPRDMYYSLNNEVRDWTNKVDVSTIEFNRIDDYLYKCLEFKDKANEDVMVKDYNSYEYVEGEFGEEIVFGELYVNEDEKLEIGTHFGQTMVVPVNTSAKFIEFPSMITFTDGKPKEKEIGDKMLFLSKNNMVDESTTNMLYNGEVIGLYRRQFTYNGAVPFDYTLLTPYNITSTYNWSGHLNHPYGKDTADLNYGWANWYMENLNFQWVTNNNAYNRFYKNMVDNYNDVDARLMKCNAYISPSDIAALQLSDTILVNGIAYHINKISQWKNNEKAVKIELIKVIDSNGSIPVIPIKSPMNAPQQRALQTTTRHLLNLTKNELVVKINEANKTIEKMEKLYADLDARLKKLEGDGSTSTDPPKDDGSNQSSGDGGTGTIKDEEEKPYVVHDSFRKESPGEVIPPWKMKMTDYPWYKHQQQFYSGYSHTGSPISRSSNIN